MVERWLTGGDPDDRDGRARLVASAGDDLTDLIRRIMDSFLGRCVRRFIDMAGIDRSMVLASQAFTTMIPLLILGVLGRWILFVECFSHSDQCASRKTRDTACVVVSTSVMALE